MLACNLVEDNWAMMCVSVCVAMESENPIPTIIRIIDTIVYLSIHLCCAVLCCVEKKNVSTYGIDILSM